MCQVPFKIEAHRNSSLKRKNPEDLTFAQKPKPVPTPPGGGNFFYALNLYQRSITPMSSIEMSSHIGVVFFLSVIDMSIQTITESSSCATSILDRTWFASY